MVCAPCYKACARGLLKILSWDHQIPDEVDFLNLNLPLDKVGSVDPQHMVYVPDYMACAHGLLKILFWSHQKILALMNEIQIFHPDRSLAYFRYSDL
jgi:hypothetical protein